MDQYCCHCHHLQLHRPVLDVAVPHHSLWSTHGYAEQNLGCREERWVTSSCAVCSICKVSRKLFLLPILWQYCECLILGGALLLVWWVFFFSLVIISQRGCTHSELQEQDSLIPNALPAQGVGENPSLLYIPSKTNFIYFLMWHLYDSSWCCLWKCVAFSAPSLLDLNWLACFFGTSIFSTSPVYCHPAHALEWAHFMSLNREQLFGGHGTQSDTKAWKFLRETSVFMSKRVYLASPPSNELV